MKLIKFNPVNIKPGIYTGYISGVNVNDSDGTEFVNFDVTIERRNGEDIVLSKGFVTNEGRNQKLFAFVDSLGIVKNNQAKMEDAIDFSVEVKVIRNEYGEIKIDTISPLEDDIDDEEAPDSEEGDAEEEGYYEPDYEDELYDDFDFEEDDD